MPQPKPPESYRKPCTLCTTPRDVLVRCQIDPASIDPVPSTPDKTAAEDSQQQPDQSQHHSQESSSPPSLDPKTWHFVCPGACWRRVSGGVIDGDLEKGREGYRYGGMWKNKHAGVSAKVPKRLKGKMVRGAGDGDGGEGKGGGSGEEEGKGDGD